MKKLIALLLAICIVVSLNSTAFAAFVAVGPNLIILPDAPPEDDLSPEEPEQLDPYEPLNSNFKKRATFSEEEIDLEALEIADWCREDFIHLYELGFTELAQTSLIRINQKTQGLIPTHKFTRYMLATSTFYNFLKMYYGEEPFTITYGMSQRDFSVMLKYLTQKGILHTKEATEASNNNGYFEYTTDFHFKENYTSGCAPAFSFGQANKRETTIATRQDIQVLLTRLFDVVDIGEPINSLDKITDVDTSDSNNIDFNGVLELYNMGIFAGNNHGAFNAYDYMTLNEFVTVLARVCFPNRRVHINSEDYYKKMKLPYETIQTYNSIDPYWYQRIKELSNLDVLYVGGTSPDRVMNKAEVYYIISAILDSGWHKKTIGPYEVNSKKYRDKLTTASEYLKNSPELFDMPISKKELAKQLVTIAERFLIKMEPANITVKKEFLQSIPREDIHIFSKAVSLGLLEETAEDFSDKAITLSELDKILVHFILKFSLAIDQNFYSHELPKRGDNLLNLVTNPALLPSNMEYFPYITDQLPKEVYEAIDLANLDLGAPTVEKYLELHGNPRNQYNPASINYPMSEEIIQDYFNIILNVDYRTITAEDFARAISDCFFGTVKANSQAIANYVNYVKKNKIILSGKGTPDFSATFFYDKLITQGYLVACKIEVNVLNSEIENPELFLAHWDEGYIIDPDNPTIRYTFVPIAPILLIYNGNSDKMMFKLCSLFNVGK